MNAQDLAPFRALLQSQSQPETARRRGSWGLALSRKTPAAAAKPVRVVRAAAPEPLILDTPASARSCVAALGLDRIDDFTAAPLPPTPQTFGRRTERCVASAPVAEPTEKSAAERAARDRVWLRPRDEDVVEAFTAPDEPTAVVRAARPPRASPARRVLTELDAALRRERRIIDARIAVARVEAAALELADADRTRSRGEAA